MVGFLNRYQLSSLPILKQTWEQQHIRPKNSTISLFAELNAAKLSWGHTESAVPIAGDAITNAAFKRWNTYLNIHLNVIETGKNTPIFVLGGSNQKNVKKVKNWLDRRKVKTFPGSR